jgi:hypothetical protein
MASRCQGCRIEVSVEWGTGRTLAADGSAGTATFNDPVLVVWDCPACGYPHADEWAEHRPAVRAASA